jgi:hypothetical protein
MGFSGREHATSPNAASRLTLDQSTELADIINPIFNVSPFFTCLLSLSQYVIEYYQTTYRGLCRRLEFLASQIGNTNKLVSRTCLVLSCAVLSCAVLCCPVLCCPHSCDAPCTLHSYLL